MELKFAFLSQFAALTQDNRLVAMGVDFDGLRTDGGFPLGAQFAMVIKLWVNSDEAEHPHTVQVFLTKPDEVRKPIQDPKRIATVPTSPGSRSTATVLINMSVGFDRPGNYRFHVEADGKELTTLDLSITGPSDNPSEPNAPGNYPIEPAAI